MIWLLAIYLVIGALFYWKATWEDDGCVVALAAVLLWPVFLIYIAVSIHSGSCTVSWTNRKGVKRRWRRADGEWKEL